MLKMKVKIPLENRKTNSYKGNLQFFFKFYREGFTWNSHVIELLSDFIA